MYKFKEDPTILPQITDFIIKTSEVNISSKSFKAFLGAIAHVRTFSKENETYLATSFKALLKITRQECRRDLFAFNGQPNSGLNIQLKKEIPKDGFCFFGWIRYERPQNNKMCIFKLGLIKTHEIEFFLQDCFLHYSVLLLLMKDY